MPAKHAGSVGCHSRSGFSSIEYPEFIVERKIDGTLVKEVPNRDKLQPFVYFDPRVLKRYYDEPSKYTVRFGSPGYGSVSDIHGWKMAIGTTDEGLVFCWLGDIAKSFMPPGDVAHWHAHNVPPRGTPAKAFVRAQLHGEFDTEADLVTKLVLCRDQFKKTMSKKSVTVYRPYAGPHCHLEKLLRKPLLNEFPEFRECIINLTTIFVEYLDSESLRQSLPVELTKDEKGNSLPSISLLANILKECGGAGEEVTKPLVDALRLVQKVRSKSGAAHSFSDRSFTEVLEKLGFSGTSTAAELFLAVAEPLATAMERLCVSLGAEELLLWRHKKE